MEDQGSGRDRARGRLVEPHEREAGHEEQGEDDGLGAVVAAEGAGEEPEDSDREVTCLRGGRVDAGELDVLGAVGSQRPGSGEAAQEPARPAADRGALLLVERCRTRQVPAQRQPIHRQGDQSHETQPPVHGGQPDRGHHDHEDGLDDERQDLGGGLAHLARIVRHAGDQVAGARALDGLRIERQSGTHDIGAEPCHRRHRDTCQRPRPDPRAQRHDEAREGDRDRAGPDDLGAGSCRECVDETTDRPRPHEARSRIREARDEEDDHPAGPSSQVGHEAGERAPLGRDGQSHRGTRHRRVRSHRVTASR